jgi:NAD(P)-dependent dehydrogenase (short-subunit alcohol dehydrogenase family)
MPLADPLQPLRDRVALVTGGGTGIGAAISGLLADRGARVVIGQPTAELAEACAAQIREGTQRDVVGVGADLRTAAACSELVAACVERHGRLDILVNNAAVVGVPALGDIFEFDDGQLDDIVDVNLKAVFRCSRHAARSMRAHGSGVIVNVTSVGAYAAQDRASAYVATKAAVAGLTRGLAFELAPHGIRVVAVAPGDIDLAAAPGRPDVNAYDELPSQWWSRRAPLGRRGNPADIANAVAFLASDEASYVTGQSLIVDGGWLSY